MSLTVYGTKRIIGQIEQDGEQLRGSTPGVQSMADAWVRRMGSAAAAYAQLRGYTNGYLTIIETPPGGDQHDRGQQAVRPHGEARPS